MYDIMDVSYLFTWGWIRLFTIFIIIIFFFIFHVFNTQEFISVFFYLYEGHNMNTFILQWNKDTYKLTN